MGSLGRICALVSVVLAVFCGVCIQKGGGDWDHFPEILRPYRPLPEKLIIGFFKIFREDPLQILSEESMLAQACQLAKLPAGAACEYDMPGESADWKESWKIWRKDANENAHMHGVGRYILNEYMTDLLKARIRQIHAWRKMPELGSTPITRPIFILGMHRTGSTLLFNLMSAAENLRAPLHWEYSNPITGEGETVEGNLKDIQNKVDLKMFMLPGLEHIHGQAVDWPEECLCSMAQSMSGLIPLFANRSPKYAEHMMSRTLNVDHMMKHHKRNLQWFQATANDTKSSGRRWLLKAPFWSMHIKDIEKMYPDAVFILTHRAPHRVMGSFSSLVTKWRSLGSDDLDLKYIGAETISLHEEMLRRILEARARWKDDPAMAGRVFDVHLADLAKDPVGVAEKLVGDLGEKVSTETRTAMQEWLKSGQSHSGKHPVNLADFGISTEAMLANPVFQAYCKEFSVADC